jgi:methionyl-tRNA synthetase
MEFGGLPTHTTEYLNYENDKFSKSRGVGVFGSKVSETGIPIDVWRYYLFALRPESSDTVFQWKDLIARNNNELLSNLGNFVNRIMKFASDTSKYGGILPDFVPDEEFGKAITGGGKVMAISTLGNQYLQENRLTKKLFTNNRQQCNNVIGNGINLIHSLATLVQPFIPQTSRGILEQLNVDLKPLLDESFKLELKANHQLGAPRYLFSRIDASKEAEFKAQFGGDVTVNK